jgi:hypothetical protein
LKLNRKVTNQQKPKRHKCVKYMFILALSLMQLSNLPRPTPRTGLALLAVLALLLVPLALGMAQPVGMDSMHSHHTHHTSEAPIPNHSCEQFHMCCACLLPSPTALLQFDVVRVLAMDVRFQSIPQDIPKPPPRW